MIIQIPQSLSVIGLLILLISYSSCKQELAVPVSKAPLGYHSNNGNEQPNKAITLKNGNTVIVGEASNKAFLLVLSPKHQKIAYTRVSGQDRAVYTDVIETADGNILALGTTEEDIAEPEAISILTKFSQTGDILWSQDTVLGNAVYNSLISLPNGNMLLSGRTEQFAGLGTIVEIDQHGKIVWSKTYQRYTNGWTAIENTTILPNGNYLLTATANSRVTFSPISGCWPGDIHLIEIDKESKNIVKISRFGRTCRGQVKFTKFINSGISVVYDKQIVFLSNNLDSLFQKELDLENPILNKIDDELYVVGGSITSSTSSVQSVVVHKLNTNLDIEWTSEYGSSLNPKSAIHLSKKEEYLEVLFTYYDSVLEDIVFGFL